ncbi:MAG: DTW domain-containing protein [Archangium sp.]|nr:DTW domain-containing protein [Archangium sp.]
MRSHTTSDLPGRCRRCWVRTEFCVCADIPQVATATRVLVVRHERESFKSTGTARIAGLALSNSAIIDVGEGTAEADATLRPQLRGACLLFPGEGTAPWPSTPPSQLVVLDGTWRQTRRMFAKLPSLHALPRLQLPTKPEPVLRLRESTFAEGRSTLEAIADALALLEGPDIAEPLHRLHAKYVEQVFRARGVWALKNPAAGFVPEPQG